VGRGTLDQAGLAGRYGAQRASLLEACSIILLGSGSGGHGNCITVRSKATNKDRQAVTGTCWLLLRQW